MNRRAAGAAAIADVRTHVAARAWVEFAGDSQPPVAVECVKESSRKSKVYRLRLGCGVPQLVIAKWRPQPDLIDVEVFTKVLPTVGLAAPVVYGALESEQHGAWVFLEDLGDERPTLSTPTEREQMSEWLAALVRVETFGALAERDAGPPHYRAMLETSRRAIVEGVDHPWLSESSREVLRRALGQLEQAAGQWDAIVSVCASAPRTLVHGDLVTKNVRVRRHRAGASQLVVFDWEKSGVGVPSVDLSSVACDLSHYVHAVRPVWAGVSCALVEELARAGRLFRSIARLSWQVAALPYEWSHAVSFERSAQLLCDAVRDLRTSA